MRETAEKLTPGQKAAKDCPKCQKHGAFEAGLECPDYVSPAPKPRKLTAKEAEKQEAIDHLRKILKPGDRVYGIVRTVSRSGMSRTIDFYTFQAGDRCDRVYLSGWIATALDYKRTEQGALKVGGCGMDMIFHVVYSLGYVLFPGGFGIPCGKCGIRALTLDFASRLRGLVCGGGGAHEFWGRNGDRSGWDDDGGYALKHESL
jgi:hypothetical protein